MVDIVKEKTLDELNDEFNSLNRKRMKQIIELEETTKELVRLSEMVYEKSPDYVKISCPICQGKGFVETEEGKKTRCQGCQSKLFVWAKKFKEGEATNGK